MLITHKLEQAEKWSICAEEEHMHNVSAYW